MDVQQHNLNALLLGTGEFSFAEGASTELAAGKQGYKDWGNVTAFTVKPDKQTEDHIGSYRGVRRVDTTAVKQTRIDYQIKFDEITADKLMSLYYGSATTPFTQAVATAAAGDVLGFTALAAVIGNWYDLTLAGARVKEITTATFSHGVAPAVTLVEGVDFILDRKLGRVQFLTAQAADLSVAITAPAIAVGGVGYRSAIIPQTRPIRRGIGRLICFDQDDADIVSFEHTGFGCEIYLESMDEVTGDKYTNVVINVQITSPVGVVLARNQ